MKLMISNTKFKKKPQHKDISMIKCSQRDANTIKNVNLYELKAYIENGQTITPAVLTGSSANDWREQQLFMVDIDNENDTNILSVDKAIEIAKDNKLQVSFFYESFSSSNEKPKFRLGFICDEVITSPGKRFIIQKTLNGLYSQADNSCINADRIFFGTDKQVYIVSQEKFSFDDIMKINEKKSLSSSSMHNELEELKAQFDFEQYIKQQNGAYIDHGYYIMFNECSLCGHKEDLVYYRNTNTFVCFSANGGAKGSIIDYLMAHKKMDLKTAIEYFKYDLMGISRLGKGAKCTINILNNSSLNIQKKLNELKAEKYYTNDKETAKLFAEAYKDICRYCEDDNCWYVFNGVFWENNNNKARELIKEFTNEIIIYISNTIEDDNQRKIYINYYNNLNKCHVRDMILTDSKSIFPIKQKDFDKDVLVINCQNGTYNLKTGEFHEHRASDFITKVSNVVYDKECKNTEFSEYIHEIMEGNLENIEYVQSLLGLCLTGLTTEKCLWILYGVPNTSKSLFINIFSYLLKDYALTISPETITQKKNANSGGASSDIARLNGARFVTCNEPQQDTQLNCALIKTLVGNDTIVARKLYCPEKEFKPFFKLFIVTNYLPVVTDTTVFSSNRIKVIPFRRQISEPDKMLLEKFKNEDVISGAFNWCLIGLKKYLENNELPYSQDISQITSQYASNADSTNRFIKDCLEYTGKNTSFKKVHDEFLIYCAKQNIANDSRTVFKQKLQSKNMLGKDLTTVDTGRTETNVIRGYELKP